MYTIVTGFFDIKGENWPFFPQPLNYYLYYFHNVLQLSAPMVVFVEDKFVQFVKDARQNIPYKTSIVTKTLCDLYMYRYHDLLYDIQKDRKYARYHPNPYSPKIAQPLYALTTINKLDLLLQGTNFALTDYCIWLDGSYTHGTINLKDYEYEPESLYAITNRLSLISLQPLTEMISDDPLTFFNQNIDIVSGGFLGGHKETIATIHQRYYQLVHQILVEKRIKDDDQFYWTLLIKKHPELFNLIPGGQYDGLNIK